MRVGQRFRDEGICVRVATNSTPRKSDNERRDTAAHHPSRRNTAPFVQRGPCRRTASKTVKKGTPGRDLRPLERNGSGWAQVAIAAGARATVYVRTTSRSMREFAARVCGRADIVERSGACEVVFSRAASACRRRDSRGQRQEWNGRDSSLDGRQQAPLTESGRWCAQSNEDRSDSGGGFQGVSPGNVIGMDAQSTCGDSRSMEMRRQFPVPSAEARRPRFGPD